MLAATLLILSSICADTAHVKKESVNLYVRDNFVKKTGEFDKSQVHEVVFAVQQLNLDEMERISLERSSPSSPLYQKWLTYSEVNSYVSNPEGAAKVNDWLRSNGIEPSWQSKHHHYIKARAPIKKWESLFNAEFHVFEDQSSSKNTQFFRTLEYSLPEELNEHVAAVFNTVQVPPSLHRRVKRKNSLKNTTEPRTESFKTNLRFVPPKSETPTAQMKPLTYGINVEFLNYWYDIPSNIGDMAVSQSVFETSDEYFSPNDLTQYQTMNDITPQAAQVIGGHSTSTCSSTGYGKDCYEGNLDIQFIMGVAQQTTSIYWYVETAVTDPFVLWLGDIADDSNPSMSNSISWGEDEIFVSKSVMDSFNTEALKLSTMGVSVFVSSGDDGIAGDYCSTCRATRRATPMNCPCIADSGSSGTQWRGSGTWTGQGYFPSFPATSPYVTAVGATMGPEEDLSPEVACQSQLGGVITTGGGFSTYYATPSWQTDALNSYYSHLDSSNTPSPGYNPRGRGYPDVSLIGVYYETVIASNIEYLFGTSASTPFLAALISLVNARRLENGLPSVGFINPSLYAASAWPLYTDVTSGHIKCCSDSADPPNPVCCTSGFTATPGWDPVSGFGSITFNNLVQVLGGVGNSPSAAPSSASPTVGPTVAGTSAHPTVTPYRMPIPASPSAGPTVSNAPIISQKPTAVPTVKPTRTPTIQTTLSPSAGPTAPTPLPSIKRKLPNGGYTSGHK